MVQLVHIYIRMVQLVHIYIRMVQQVQIVSYRSQVNVVQTENYLTWLYRFSS